MKFWIVRRVKGSVNFWSHPTNAHHDVRNKSMLREAQKNLRNAFDCEICPRRTSSSSSLAAALRPMSSVFVRSDVHEKWKRASYQKKNIKKVHESSPCILPVTSCVSSWLLLLTMLTDMFLDDCRNSGRPCRERRTGSMILLVIQSSDKELSFHVDSGGASGLSTSTWWQVLKLNYREKAVLISDGLTSRFEVITRDRY